MGKVNKKEVEFNHEEEVVDMEVEEVGNLMKITLSK